MFANIIILKNLNNNMSINIVNINKNKKTDK